jgi:hypothetical protein
MQMGSAPFDTRFDNGASQSRALLRNAILVDLGCCLQPRQTATPFLCADFGDRKNESRRTSIVVERKLALISGGCSPPH